MQALGTPAPDRPVHLQDLTVIAMTMDEQMTNNPRKTQQRGMATQTRQRKLMNEIKNQKIIILRSQLSLQLSRTERYKIAYSVNIQVSSISQY